jgi:hypothetical protein
LSMFTLKFLLRLKGRGRALLHSLCDGNGVRFRGNGFFVAGIP